MGVLGPWLGSRLRQGYVGSAEKIALSKKHTHDRLNRVDRDERKARWLSSYSHVYVYVNTDIQDLLLPRLPAGTYAAQNTAIQHTIPLHIPLYEDACTRYGR